MFKVSGRQQGKGLTHAKCFGLVPASCFLLTLSRSPELAASFRNVTLDPRSKALWSSKAQIPLPEWFYLPFLTAVPLTLIVNQSFFANTGLGIPYPTLLYLVSSWATPSNAQELLLALLFGIRPDGAHGTIRDGEDGIQVGHVQG